MVATRDDIELTNDFGWPQTLCVIDVGEGRYAANSADTKGFEPDPQVDIKGLAVFTGEQSANSYMGSLNGMSGKVVPKTFEECREIVVNKPVLSALFLMDGSRIIDMVFVR